MFEVLMLLQASTHTLRRCTCLDKSHLRVRLLSASGNGVNKSSHYIPYVLQVCNQTPPIGEKPSLMTFRVCSNHLSLLHGTLAIK